jgi:hypothetical protein
LVEEIKTDPRARKYPDRRLGSSWYEWDGDVEGHESNLLEGPVLYLALVFLLLGAVTQILLLDAWFLVTVTFSAWPVGRSVVIVLIGAPLAVWWSAYFISLAALLTRSPYFALPWLARWLTLQVPFLAFCAKPFGLSRDRIGSSCIALTNVLAGLRMKSRETLRPMLLLPRCLAPEVVREAREIAAQWGCPTAVAANNAIARERIREHRPNALLAVACERDLVSGLFDFGHKLPIFVLPNQRPHGPCLRATIDMERLRETLRRIHESVPSLVKGASGDTPQNAGV